MVFYNTKKKSYNHYNLALPFVYFLWRRKLCSVSSEVFVLFPWTTERKKATQLVWIIWPSPVWKRTAPTKNVKCFNFGPQSNQSSGLSGEKIWKSPECFYFKFGNVSSLWSIGSVNRFSTWAGNSCSSSSITMSLLGIGFNLQPVLRYCFLTYLKYDYIFQVVQKK